MRDIVVIYPTDRETQDWDTDIDIVDMEPRYVDEVNQTQDQRAAVAALIAKGTIPGDLSFGVDWSSLLNEENTLVSIDNQVRLQIASLAGIGNPEQLVQYIPLYLQNKEGGVDVTVYRAS